jgi:hypothetical protein
MNLKIRVGFKSDPNTGHPLFCPVYVESFAAAATRYCLCVLTSEFRKVWDQQDVKTMVSHPALLPIGLLTSLAGCGNSSSSQGGTLHACFVH